MVKEIYKHIKDTGSFSGMDLQSHYRINTPS